VSPEEIIGLLEGREQHPKRTGEAKWQSKCPAHADRNPSLSISVGADDRTLLTCHAGCSTDEILTALGLQARDLFVEQPSTNGNRAAVNEYVYSDATGGVVMKVIRRPGKKFSQCRPDGKGGWVWNLNGVNRVLYRLPEVIAAVAAGQTIYVVEGEKDVEALRVKVNATCNPGGAGKWLPAYSKSLTGADVVVIADRDEPGRKHAQAVAESLDGIAERVTVLEPPDPHKDVSDLLTAGGSLDDLVPLGEPVTPEPNGPEVDRPHGDDLVSAAELLARVERVLRAYIILPDDAARDALTLYVLHTWAFRAAYATPYLLIVSPEKQSGKSRLLEVLQLLVRSPWPCLSATEAALFRKIAQDLPSLLLDEIDAIFGSNSERTEPLRAILNGGNRKGAKASRVVGQGSAMTVEDFDIFCPKVLAGISTGRIPETVVDRSIVIKMQRRRAGETVQRLRWRDAEQRVQQLREQLQIWATDAMDTLTDAKPTLPEALSDRQQDGWEPLLAVADLAGGDWPERARSAALSLCGETDDGASRGALLLGAMRDAMHGIDVIATTDLLEQINTNEDLPFGAWSDGKGLDGRGLAKLLKPYGVHRTTVRIGDKTAKGYRRDELSDAWERYLPVQEGNKGNTGNAETAETTESPQNTGDVTDVTPVTDPDGVTVAQRIKEIGEMSDPDDAERAWQAMQREQSAAAH
jgi:hypothetical protein